MRDRFHRRRGSTYMIVLGSSMVVSVIGLTALMATRIQRRFSEGTADLGQARLHARSAIDVGFFKLATDADWRTNHSNGVWLADQPIGTGTYDLTVVDPVDGDLSNSDTDPLVLLGTGHEGPSRYKLQVAMTAIVSPLSCLEVSMHAGNDIVFTDATVQSMQTVSANNAVLASGASIITADVEAVNAISGGVYQGETITGIEPRALPNPATVFDYYLTNGTTIDRALLTHNGHFDLKDVVLSPASNPFGTPNNEGIYVIDLQGGELRIKHSRIVGTLVVVNPASTSRVERAVSWAPAVRNYPALLVAGSMTIRIDSDALDESGRTVNYNPPGTPYEGADDTDTLGVYPSKIRGLVYVSGNLDIENDVTIDGVVIAGNDVNSTGLLRVTYDPLLHSSPPPGFTEPPRMVVVSGSWRQVVD